jgi:hypothetical protein
MNGSCWQVDENDKTRFVLSDNSEKYNWIEYDSSLGNDFRADIYYCEPSFVTKTGSTLRMDWKEKTPDQYAMYFQCTSRLVDTFRLVFDDVFQYEEKRAIVFQLNQKIPVQELKECIKASLIYHNVKHLMTLGI